MPDGQRHTFISRCQPGKNHCTWGFGAGSSPWKLCLWKLQGCLFLHALPLTVTNPCFRLSFKVPPHGCKSKQSSESSLGSKSEWFDLHGRVFVAVEASQIPWAPHPSGNKPYRAWGPGPNRVGVIWMFTATAVAPSAGHCHWFRSILLPQNPPVHVSG